MQSTVSLHRQACRAIRPAGTQLKSAAARPVRVVTCSARLQSQQEVVTDSSPKLDMLSLTLATMMVQPLAAHADELEAATNAAADAASKVTEAASQAAEKAANTVDAPAWLGYVVLLSPIILYGAFNVYRSNVNPRAKFTDFLFVCAGVAVIANLVSILAFKVRLF